MQSPKSLTRLVCYKFNLILCYSPPVAVFKDTSRIFLLFNTNSFASSTQFLSLFFFNSHTKPRNQETGQREGERERERERSLHQFSYADPSSPSSPRLKPWHQISTCTPLPPSHFPPGPYSVKFSLNFLSFLLPT